MTQTDCPYLDYCERDFTGPALDDEELESLSRHLSDGCPTCEGRIEENLTGSGDSDAARSVREIDERISTAVDYAGDAMASSQVSVLENVKLQIGAEDRETRRRVRRRHQRTLFYLVNLAAVFLLAAAYVGTVMAARVRSVAARGMSTQNELHAMATALSRYVRDYPSRVPRNGREFFEALGEIRKGGSTPYYPLDAARLEGFLYRDEFDRPYRYDYAAGRVVIYSCGPDRKDDDGLGDDLSKHLQFAHE